MSRGSLDPKAVDKMANFLKKKADEQAASSTNQFSKIDESGNYENDGFEEDEAIRSYIQSIKSLKLDQSKVNVVVKEEAKKDDRKIVPQRVSSQKLQKKVVNRKPYQFNKLADSEKEKVFLDVYDENLKLKEKQQTLEQYYQNLEVKFNQMNRLVHANQANTAPIQSQPNQALELENQRLKEKLLALSNANKVVSVKQHSKPKKLVTVTEATAAPQHQQNTGTGTDAQIKELLKLNDMLKKRCLEQESQFRSLQAMMNSKMVNQTDMTQKNQQLVTLKERQEKMEQHMQGMRNQLDDERKRQSEIMQMLKEEKDKNFNLESQIRSMELATKSVHDLQMDLVEARRQKKEMQEQLTQMMESPFFKDYGERAQVQSKMKTLEKELAVKDSEMRNLRENAAKLETENKLNKETLDKNGIEIRQLLEKNKELEINMKEKEQQLLPFKDLNYWDNDQFLKVLGNLKWTGEEPAWKKVDFIDRTYMDSNDPNILRKEIEHLKLEKGELAAHLEKSQTLLRTNMDIQIEKDQVHKSELEKLQLQLKAALSKVEEYAQIADLKNQAQLQKTLYEANGVQYEGSVDEFSVDDEEEVSAGENFFDLWIGQADLNAAGLQSSYKDQTGSEIDVHSLLTFLTIDFHDHDTQHTSVCEGIKCSFNLQVSFKVEANAPFISYLESEFLKIELYVSQGSGATKVGIGLQSLKDLVLVKDIRDTVSKVLSGTITINGQNNQFVGICLFKARMRFPISQLIRWLKDQQQLNFTDYNDTQDNVVAIRKRKLVVAIEKASNLPSRASTLVYYSLDNKDFNTNTQQGANPRWDYRMVHDIQYNEQFIQTVKRAKLEFYLLDDNMPLAEGGADTLGIASLDLNPLLNNDMIDVSLQVKQHDEATGSSLIVKVFWYDIREDDGHDRRNVITMNWEDTITSKISSELRSRGLGYMTAFQVFDKDMDSVISLNDFVNGMNNILSIKLNPQELQLYFQKLPQPLNQLNFETFFKIQVIEFQPSQVYQTQDLSKINEIISKHSMQLQVDPIEDLKEQIASIFRKELQKKTKQEIFREIDSSRPDGFLSLEELQKWLNFKGLQVQSNPLRQFISNYMDINRDSTVDINEFQKFILNDLQPRSLARQATIPQQQQVQARNPVSLALLTILNFAQENSWTLMKVRDIMDQNKDSFISKQEMHAFLTKFGVISKVNSSELETIMKFFDTNGDGQISIQEFADALSKENNQHQIITQQATYESLEGYVVQYLVAYMKKKNQSLAQLFNDIDSDNSATLTKDELRNMFRNKILVPIDPDDLDMLFRKFDQNNDKKISIKEFLAIMKPAQQATEQLEFKGAKSSVNIESLRRRAEEVAYKSSKLLTGNFQKQANKTYPALISPQDFQQILIDLQMGFSPAEISVIMDQFCTKERGMINYQSFIALGRTRGEVQKYESFGQSQSAFGQMSQYDQNNAIERTNQVFQKLKRLVKGDPQYKNLFNTFDIDQDKKLNKKDIIQTLLGMKQISNEKDGELIFNTLDKNGKGWVTLAEFQEQFK